MYLEGRSELVETTIDKELQETAIAFLKWARNTLENDPVDNERISLVPEVAKVACHMITHLKDQGAGESPEQFVQKLQQPEFMLLFKEINQVVSSQLYEKINSYSEQLNKRNVPINPRAQSRILE